LSLRFSINQLPKELQAAVRAAAVPRFFDRAFLNALLNQPLDEGQFAELLEQPYVEPYPGEGRFNVHERSRRLLQERLWQEDETLYREISRRAFVYCQRQDQKDITWRIETIYHQVIADLKKGWIALNNTCANWVNPPYFAYDRMENLLQAVYEHNELKRLTEKAKQYILLNQARVDIHYNRCDEAKEALQQIRQSSLQDDHYLKLEVLLCLGKVYYLLSMFNDAIQSYDEAMPLCRANKNRLYEADRLQHLGQVHFCFFDFKKARRYYDKALLRHNRPLGKANCLLGIGIILFHLSKFKKSRSHLKRALKLFQQVGDPAGKANCILYLGKVHLAYSEFPEAQQHFNDSLKLYRKIENQRGEANTLQSFGDLSVKIGDFIAAKQYYEQTSALAEHIHCPEGVIECLEGFAELHQAQGQVQQAAEYWQKAADTYYELSMPLRADKCLEQVRKLKKKE
ncbi:MAG: tetratricopeptide repeat protein, partial [Candidatus Electrothrix sp. GM3_4]|nr:tetratricopeptide repeat protein [Candidatus Electrothrix sp. GM3_4]